MENKKKGKGLIIFFIILVLLLGTCLVLLLTGIVKNPFVKEEKCKVETKVTTKTEPKEEKKEKETRYYQSKGESEKEDNEGNRLPRYTEIELNENGTAKINYLRVNDVLPKSGIFVEDDKYIILTLNTDYSECYEGNYTPMLSDSCTETLVFIKDQDVLKTQYGSIYHFEIDDVNSSQEFIQVKKSELQTDLKN